MNTIFIHSYNNLLNSNLIQLNGLFQAYHERDAYLDRKLHTFFIDAKKQFSEINHNALSSKFENFQATLEMAQSGTNPFTLEKNSFGKSSMLKAVCYKLLQDVQTELFREIEKIEKKIFQTEELIKQLLLGAFQKGLLDPTLVLSLQNPVELGKWWEKIKQDDTLKMFCFSILLTIIKEDAFLLIQEKLTQLI